MAKSCQYAFYIQRSTTDSSLSLNISFKSNKAAIFLIGIEGLLALNINFGTLSPFYPKQSPVRISLADAQGLKARLA